MEMPAPSIENGTVVQNSRRKPYSEIRAREFLTDKEVEELMGVARQRGRYEHRDATMILLAYRHGLRVSELCALRWEDVDLNQGFLHVRRIKRGVDSVHPLRGVELRALRRLQRHGAPSPYLFNSERGGPMSPAGFRKMLSRCGELSKLGFPVVTSFEIRGTSSHDQAWVPDGAHGRS
ncbi:MAG: type 1 fimbriae regulatory protein FimB/type 1 fimbriae regulatory protein FimE [Candidatus Kentron sp. G]|nr:MAG: type 1 fimbriae regulatory protein FimB/type 1 fimbriae regulatory protein FimE [Candidatus Kentron sp. G]VFN06792.1 MAG: type 1 fimbriae regulatory protein FimB/type 1 fimbriae regulatory protein FimE [Candidatus Kentron sp. G]VFN07649.1 MAG: type 1 fimbriae regulatory protein FimB/type 1 fimbriae regulatory protein FimE [Candidatus Kentron sp. G]